VNDDKMTELRTGMNLLQNANKSVLQRGRLTRNFPIASLLALVISLAGCLAFCVLFHYAVTGFIRQVNELIPLGEFVPIHLVNVAIGVLYSLMAITYFIVGTISTRNMRNNANRKRHFCLRQRKFLATHVNFLAVMVGVTYVSVILWVHIFAITTIITIIYLAFITATYKVCLLFDGKCVDFTPFLPLLAPIIPEGAPKFSLNFCEKKRIELCHTDQNLLSLFIVANAMCLVALISLIHFLMCMVANWKEQKVSETYKVRPRDSSSMDLDSEDLKDESIFLKKRKTNDKAKKIAQRLDSVELLENQLFERRRQAENEPDEPIFAKRLDSVVERYEGQMSQRRLQDGDNQNP